MASPHPTLVVSSSPHSTPATHRRPPQRRPPCNTCLPPSTASNTTLEGVLPATLLRLRTPLSILRVSLLRSLSHIRRPSLNTHPLLRRYKQLYRGDEPAAFTGPRTIRSKTPPVQPVPTRQPGCEREQGRGTSRWSELTTFVVHSPHFEAPPIIFYALTYTHIYLSCT